MTLILGIDAGNYKAKVAGPYGVDTFRTVICEWFEQDTVEVHGEDDMEFEIDGRKGFSGSIAALEDELGGLGMYGDNKAHEDSKIRILLAIYRYRKKYNNDTERVRFVTGQPIRSHKDTEKEKIIKMLEGTHRYVVNGEKIKILIDKVAVAAEGSGAFWSNPEMGTVRIIDIGSGTLNFATIIDGRYINTSSNTFNFGMETVNNKQDLASIARTIVRAATSLKWNRNDTVLICGGSAAELLPYLIEHFQKARLLEPILKNKDSLIIEGPVFGNAIGFYDLACENLR